MINQTDQTFFRLSNLNAEQQRISYQSSTGKKLQDGSDDSVLFSRENFVDDKIRMYDGLKTQIEKTTAQNNIADSSMAGIKKILEFIKSELIKANTDTTDDAGLKAIAVNIAGMKESIFDLANTQVEGEYVFAGSDSSVRPFVKDADGNISYVGDNKLRKIAVEDGSYRERGISGFDMMMFTSDSALKNETLTFSKEDRILDQDGNEWRMREPIISEGSTFSSTIEPSKTPLQFVDSSGKNWTLDNSKHPLQLDDGAGNKVPATFDGVDTYSFTISGMNSSIKLANSSNPLEFTDDAGQNWTLDKSKVPLQLEDGLGNIVPATFNGTDTYNFSIHGINSSIITTPPKDSLQFIDGNNQLWTLNPNVQPLELNDGLGNTVPATFDGVETYSFDVPAGSLEMGINELVKYDKTGELVEPEEILVPTISENGREIVTPNIDGTRFEAKTNIFNVIDDVVNALNKVDDDGNPISNDIARTLIGDISDQITKAYDDVNVSHAELGGRNKVFEASLERVSSKLTQYNIFAVELGAVDLAKVAIEAKSLELTYTALYSTINKTNQLSLVNFLN
uniref:flagellin N-terminal helical domain-containing protein n=1 Tax=Aliarcobacter sp. TaxID=2321116 RepID=UPI0040476195